MRSQRVAEHAGLFTALLACVPISVLSKHMKMVMYICTLAYSLSSQWTCVGVQEPCFGVFTGVLCQVGSLSLAKLPGSQNCVAACQANLSLDVEWGVSCPNGSTSYRRWRPPCLEPLLAVLSPYWSIKNWWLWERPGLRAGSAAEIGRS